MGCDIELIDARGTLNSSISIGDVIVFKMDNSSGTTVQWEGTVDEKKSKLNADGFTLQIIGSHYTSKLLDITVTEEFVGSTSSSILTSLVNGYLTGYTTNNVTTTTDSVTKSFVNTPLLDCIIFLMESGNDCYVDNDKDFHYFQKESMSNPDEAIVWNDSLIELQGIGFDGIDVKNKIVVYGDAGGLPVIHTSEDTASQTSYGVKEQIIEENSISNPTTASEIGASSILNQKNPPVKGNATTTFMYPLNPGEMLWVVYPPQNVQSEYRVTKYTYHLPEQRMDFVFSRENSVSKLFKKRDDKDLKQENIRNRFKMKYSYNFTFDDESNIDSSSSITISVADGKLGPVGASATMISNAKSETISATQCHVQAIGEGLNNALFYIAFDNDSTWQLVTLDSLVSINSASQGMKPRIKVVISSATTFIDSLALLYK